MRLLIVEDDPQLRKFMGIALNREGYSVTAAPDAETALELYDREMAGDRSFDLVLLDLTLPAMSGQECLRRLAGPPRQAKVIITSGMPREDGPLFDQSLGCAKDYLLKPFTLTHLMESVQRALDCPA